MVLKALCGTHVCDIYKVVTVFQSDSGPSDLSQLKARVIPELSYGEM